jgi:hypothetical protein
MHCCFLFPPEEVRQKETRVTTMNLLETKSLQNANLKPEFCTTLIENQPAPMPHNAMPTAV